LKQLLAAAVIALSATALFADPPSYTTYPPVPTADIAQHPEWDAEYTRLIRQNTTGAQFLTALVDHLPASAIIPTPLKFHGYISGAEGHLTYAEDVYRYLRALEAASPRVKVFSIGRSEEGREMIVAAVSSEETIAHLDRYRDITRRLADPRTLSDADAKKLTSDGKAIYYLTGTIHSPETGSPEMLMELAYRLAVDDTPAIRSIRDNVITLITPVVEVDGRDRMVDLARYHAQNPALPVPPLVYWGHYVAHDNNRDQLGMALALSKNITRTFMEWHPQVLHDLHESIPFLYISTGTGPYNPALDPAVINEQHRMAYHEVGELTNQGIPGVWTHGFYDGWAPNYMFWAALGHNGIGRFYETFGNSQPSTENRVVRGNSDRQWYRPNPPLPQVRWSLRNNVNYQQSGVLLALTDMAANREHFLQQFYELGKRSIAKAASEGPAAYVFDGAQKRQGQLRGLMALLQAHGIEVQVADAAFSVTQEWPPAPPKSDKPADTKKEAEAAKDADAGRPAMSPAKNDASKPNDASKTKEPEALKFAAGSFIVRMDQPYSRLADTLLDTQYVRGDERVYDDTGWTLGYQKNVEWKRIVSPSVLGVAMHPWKPEERKPAKLAGAGMLVENHADVDLARLRFAAPGAKMSILEQETTAGGRKWPAGTIVIANDAESREKLDAALAGVSIAGPAADALPAGKMHALATPRVALVHTWIETQDEGWFRLALESLGIPYTYVSTQDLSREPNLRGLFDVLLFPPTGDNSPQEIVNGLPGGAPLPWRKTPLTPNLGVDETDDMRPGLGLQGVANIPKFVEDGGLFIAVRDAAEFAVTYGIARYVRVLHPEKLKSPGTIVQATFTDRTHPVAWGYDESLPVYYSGSPVFKVGVLETRDSASRPSGRGGKNDPDVPQGRPFVPLPERPKPAAGEEGFQPPEDLPWRFAPYLPPAEERPRVILSFAKDAAKLWMSGMLEGGDDIAGTPVVIDAPRGKGHVLLFANNPMWRMNTQGTFALITNAIMNWDNLGR
jgi:hypothetical protein